MEALNFETQEKPSLPFHERFMAWLVISVLLFLIALNIIFDESTMPLTESEHQLVNPFVEIVVEGAVEFPGIYQVKKGVLIQEVLDLAKPLPEANLKRIKLDSPVNHRRVIKVSKKKEKRCCEKSKAFVNLCISAF